VIQNQGEHIGFERFIWLIRTDTEQIELTERIAEAEVKTCCKLQREDSFLSFSNSPLFRLLNQKNGLKNVQESEC